MGLFTQPGPIASFRCAVELGRYRGTADIEWDAPQSRSMRTALPPC